MQEQADRESVAITIKASKLMAQTLVKVFVATGKKIKNSRQTAPNPHGKQSVKKLMNHNVPTNTIEIEGDKGLFEKVARKWNVDYAFHKVDKDKFLLLFKSGQADAITAAFAEYSKLVMKWAKEKRPPVMDEFKKAAQRAERENQKHKEHRREREKTR